MGKLWQTAKNSRNDLAIQFMNNPNDIEHSKDNCDTPQSTTALYP